LKERDGTQRTSIRVRVFESFIVPI